MNEPAAYFLNRQRLLLVVLAALLAGCVGRSLSIPESQVVYPQTWQRLPAVSQTQAAACMTKSATLEAALNEALKSNLSVQILRSQAEEARLGVVIARADRLPSLNASLASSRRNSNGFEANSSVNNQFSLSLDAQMEIDLWNKLSAAQRQAQLGFRAAQFAYEDTQRVVLGNVARAWYTAIFSRELTDVFRQRVTSVGNNLEIVEQGYRQGITSALDVYLARTSFAQEQSRLAAQEQAALENAGALQLLLTQYPSGEFTLDSSLPALAAHIPDSKPGAVELRADVQQAWTALLAQDAAVAVAHKQRFPRLVLGASLDDLSREVSDIVDGNDVLWSVFANLTQPVFQAGRLKALEQQARLRLEQRELAYTGVVQAAFQEVEDALGNTQALRSQIAASERAFEAAGAAYDLSFSQYRRGLVSYATVLQSEQRAFDATSGLLELRYRELINRVNLCTALGQGHSK